jgi:hypothetical protein
MTVSKRGSGVMMAEAYKPKSTISLEGAHAKSVADHPIGKKATMTISATKVSHSKNSDGTHSARYEIESVDNAKEEKGESKQKEKEEND